MQPTFRSVLLKPVSSWIAANRRQRRYTELYRREIEEHRPVTDVFIVSYPKSGRTWHRMLLGGYIAALHGEEPSRAADVGGLTAEYVGYRVRYTHNAANFVDGLRPRDALVASSALWHGKKVIFIVREPKDVLVSAWFHASERYGTYRGSLSHFIRNPRLGAPKLAAAMTRWWRDRDRASTYMVTSYESLTADAGAVLRQTLTFIGGWPVEDNLINRCVAASRFESMRGLESSGRVAHSSMRSRSTTPGGRKVREGKVGGHLKHMSTYDIAYVNEQMKTSGYEGFRATVARSDAFFSERIPG